MLLQAHSPFVVRLRLVSLAAQKFLANVSHESLQIYKQRRRQTQARLKEQGLKDQKVVLTMEDTAVTLQEVRSLLVLHYLCVPIGYADTFLNVQYGINLKPAPYFLDGSKADK